MPSLFVMVTVHSRSLKKLSWDGTSQSPEAVAEEIMDILPKILAVDPNVAAKNPVVSQFPMHTTRSYENHVFSTR